MYRTKRYERICKHGRMRADTQHKFRYKKIRNLMKTHTSFDKYVRRYHCKDMRTLRFDVWTCKQITESKLYKEITNETRTPITNSEDIRSVGTVEILQSGTALFENTDESRILSEVRTLDRSNRENRMALSRSNEREETVQETEILYENADYERANITSIETGRSREADELCERLRRSIEQTEIEIEQHKDNVATCDRILEFISNSRRESQASNNSFNRLCGA